MFMVERFHEDPFENGPTPVEIRSSKDPQVPYIKGRYIQDADFLLQAVEQRKRYSKDPLTGVGSIHAFYDEVIPLVSTTNRYVYGNQPERLALAHVDIDYLKETNDRFGHAKGDELLKLVATSLRRLSRPFDRIYRLGGDEFAVVMPGFSIPVEERGEEVLLDKVNHFQDGVAVDVAAAGFPPELPAGISVGIALLSEQDDVESWLSRADQLMYQQKSLHRLEAAQSIEE